MCTSCGFFPSADGNETNKVKNEMGLHQLYVYGSLLVFFQLQFFLLLAYQCHWQKIALPMEGIMRRDCVPHSISRFEEPKQSTMSIIVNLLKLTGKGQEFGERKSLHERNARRKWHDLQLTTHLCFLVSAWLALQNKVYDLFILLLLVTPLSVLYHYRYERSGVIARLEGFSAKLLFLYGVVQMLQPSSVLIEYACMLLTICIFIGTNIFRSLYDPWHCLMHVIPAFWAAVVATHHPPLILLHAPRFY